MLVLCFARENLRTRRPLSNILSVCCVQMCSTDDSLCGGLLKPCPIRAVVSNYSTHLLGLPGNPCVMPSLVNTTNATFGPDWYRRFNGHMICTQQVRWACYWQWHRGCCSLQMLNMHLRHWQSATPTDMQVAALVTQTRRFNIWGPDQGTLLLMPPNGTQAWEMDWLGFGIPGNCWGTNCSVDEERRYVHYDNVSIVLALAVVHNLRQVARHMLDTQWCTVFDCAKARMLL
jgi:hypothetical protein